nr:Ig-like domain-containing protein [Clostridium sp. C8-1-8]
MLRVNIDEPTEGQNLSSSLKVYGWSLHKGGVNQVKVYIDSNFISNTNIGFSRPDIKRMPFRSMIMERRVILIII